MNVPIPSEINREIPISVLERAREFADGAKTGGMAMDYTTALGYAQVLERADRLPLVPLLEGEPSISAMEPTEIYYLAEALDVALSFDPDESRRWAAAALAIDINDSLMYLPHKDAKARTTILSKVLGITASPELTATEQLVERYFSSNLVDEKRFALAALLERTRISGSRT